MRFFAATTAVTTVVATIFLSSLTSVTGQTVVDIIGLDPRLTRLYSLIVSTPGMVNTLKTLEDITIFAPTDRAFRTIPNNVNWTPEQVTQMLQYHVIPGRAYREAELTNGLQLRTSLEGQSLTFQVNATGYFVNRFSQIVQPNMIASNGIIHKIGDTPLLPPTLRNAELTVTPTPRPLPPTPVPVTSRPTLAPTPRPTPRPTTPRPTSGPGSLGNILDVTASLDGFSTLVDLILLTGLDTALAAMPHATLLAPTDDAFASLDPSFLQALTTPPYRFHLQEILRYHSFDMMFRGPNLLESLSILGPTGLFLSSMNTAHDRVQFQSPNGRSLNLNNGSANVVIADVSASNGVIHAVDAVLLPRCVQDTISTTVQNDRRDLSTFNTWLNEARLKGLLNRDGPYTVFAPINEAFNEFSTGTPSVDDMIEILTYHVVQGMYPSTLIEDGMELTTVLGSTIRFRVTEMGVIMNDSVRIEMSDTVAGNGIIHKVGGILWPFRISV
ncbi:fasciclin domain containing protein [Nitzschia inconspicua]|uniref:Fasciclin domain containing protein n=1 Tax=Nitzschia inconspicua TaxID=303405 RepID=A0A9K3LNT8_9STRA|nr:fasciclin domain containing protein [Nitzschia inconspicua]